MQRFHSIRSGHVLRIARVLACLVWLPQTATALPLLSEVFYDAEGSDEGWSFVEIYGAAGSLLDGFVLEAINGSNGAVTHSLALVGVIPADGIFVLADDAGGGTSLIAGADQITAFDFQNGPDSLRLLDGAAVVVDALGYGVFGAGTFFAGEGSAADDAPAGSSLARRFADLDTNDNATDWVVQGTPTPGSAPLQPVPEPTAAILVAAGLLAISGHRRLRR